MEPSLIVLDSQHSDWLDILAAVSTAAAALFAAFSAWTSRLSAKAAKDAVDESRLARREELAPKLILEKNFLDFHFVWPHPDSLNGEAVFLARKHGKDKVPEPPTFSLHNYGQSPALDVTIVFELEDPNGEFRLPDGYEQLGLSITDTGTGTDQGNVKMLTYFKPDRAGGAGLPLYRKCTTDIPNSSPDQKRTVDFPVQLLNTLFLRGLQQWHNRQSGASSADIVLTARITCHAVDSVSYKSQFRWRVIPFHHGETDPVVVYGHFIELPMHPKPDGPRVA